MAVGMIMSAFNGPRPSPAGALRDTVGRQPSLPVADGGLVDGTLKLAGPLGTD